jgi:hypothetical protein
MVDPHEFIIYKLSEAVSIHVQGGDDTMQTAGLHFFLRCAPREMENLMWGGIRVGRVWVRVGATILDRGGIGSGEAGNLWARPTKARPQECIHAVQCLRVYGQEDGKENPER